MHNRKSEKPLDMETTCGSLLSEMQRIWDEMGEPVNERDKTLFELQQECLEVYKRKVNQASRCRAQLQKNAADSEAELAKICAALGEQSSYARQRKNQFAVVVDQIQSISKELCLHFQENARISVLDENDLSSDRLKLLVDHLTTINSLCVVFGIDYKHTIAEIDPTMDDSRVLKNISKHMILKLSAMINRLKELKKQRLLMLQDLAATLIELWNLMGTPLEGQQKFHDFTWHIADSEDEIDEPNVLSADSLQHAEAEVSRLQAMKSTKMKEVLLKKRLELEEICQKAHLVIETLNSVDFSVETIESGAVDPSYLLEQIEVQISRVLEEALSRREILEKLREDENRYNGGRGTHRNLKQAENARVLVNKIPALLSMLEQYCALKQERELEHQRQRQRDHKKLQGQLMMEQEALFGSVPSPSKSTKKNFRPSMGGSMLQTPFAGKTAPSSRLSSSLKQHTPQSAQTKKALLNPPRTESAQTRNTPLSNPPRTESTQTRKPLSPLSSSLSSNANTINIQNQTLKSGEVQESQYLNRTPVMTPTKIASAEGRLKETVITPKTLPIPIPATPSSVSSAMQTAMTPASCYVSACADDIEYSFEEIRAGYSPLSRTKVITKC
ncbi:unnamed protein product [Withania somnifera]